MKKFLLSLSVSALVLGLANAGEFELDKTHTSVNFKIKHMQVSNVRGSFKEFEATKIDFDTTTNKLNAFEAVVKSASIDTANDKRDTHLKAPDFFDSAKFVDIKFVAKNITDDKMIGELTMRGVTQEIELDYDFGGVAKTKDGKNKIGFSLEGEIDRTAYGVGEAGAMLGSEVKIEIEVEANEK